MLRKSILECILEIASTIEDDCKPFAPKAFDIILKYFIDAYQAKSNKILFGILLECLTTIGPYNEEAFNKVVPDIVQALIELVQGINFDNDPIRADLQNSLERLLPILQIKFIQLLPNLIQTVLTLIRARPKMSVSSSPENQMNFNDILEDDSKKQKQLDLKTSDTEDFAGSISLLNTIVIALGDQFLPYVNEVEAEILPLIKYPYNPKIRNKIAKILPNLIDVIVDKEDKKNRGKKYIGAIMETIDVEVDNTTCEKLFTHLHDVIDNSGFILTKEEVNKLFEKIMIDFENLEKNRLSLIQKKEKSKKVGKSKDDDSDDENLDEIIDEDIDSIECIQSEISETIGVLFKTHKDVSDDIINVILTKVLPKYLNAKASDFESKMALYIIDDMIEFLGSEKLPLNIWNDIFKAITSLAVSSNNAVRQAACYGIGIFAKFTKNNFDAYANDILNALKSALKFTPDDPEEEEEWGLAHDNIIASFGKLLFYQNNSEVIKNNLQEIISLWIEGLPIVYDSTEQEQQHEWLADMALLKKELIPEKSYPRAFTAMAKVYQSKSSNDGINDKIEKIFEQAKGIEGLQKIIEGIYQTADKLVKSKLEKLIKK